MGKLLSFDGLLTKLSTPFKSDMFIYKGIYCCGGDLTEERNEGHILCTLNPDYISMMSAKFPNIEVVYLSDVKKAKKEPDKYINTKVDKEKYEYCQSLCETLIKDIDEVSTWSDIIFSDDDINDIFIDRNLHWILNDDDTKVPVQIAKSTLPLLTEKNIKDTQISFNYKKFVTEEKNELNRLILSYNTEWFKLDEIITYVNIDDIKEWNYMNKPE